MRKTGKMLAAAMVIMLLAVGCQRSDERKENIGGSTPTESVATSEPSDAPEITPTAVPTEAVTPTVIPTETVTPTPTAEPSPTEAPTGVPEDIQEADEPEEMKIPLSARLGELPASIRKCSKRKAGLYTLRRNTKTTP